MSYYAGIDLGGTKSAACIAKVQDGKINILKRSEFPTIADSPRSTMLKLTSKLRCLLSDCCIADGFLKSIGISCGGPLDSAKGIILHLPTCRHGITSTYVNGSQSNSVSLCIWKMMQMPVPWQNGGLVQE